MAVRAKLRLHSITDFGGSAKELSFVAQYDDRTPEDRRFQKYTPTASAKFMIDNPAAVEQFEMGKSYYVDFAPAD